MPSSEAAQLAQRDRQHRRIEHRRAAKLGQQLCLAFDRAAIAILPRRDQARRRRDVAAADDHFVRDGPLQARQIVEHRALREHTPMLVFRQRGNLLP